MTSAHKLTAHERRQAIVQSAIQLFSEKGFRGTTTREIAAAVGVSEPVLYQHFTTKSDLYAAIIDSKSADVQKIVQAFQTFLDNDDDQGFFTHLADLILEFHENDPAYLRLLLYSALERHELSALFHERQACAFANIIVQYIDRRIQQGAFRSLDAAFIAQSFMGMVAHCGMDKMLGKAWSSSLTRQQSVQAMVDIFLKGIQS